ncbi:hypothetical protein [Demequina sp.]|uniref:hypothetical protein n=1 Tax=Demequina sp. TaxID=2050685 RepID=UPI003A8B73B7
MQERLSDPAFLEALESTFAPAEWERVVQEQVAVTVFCRAEFAEYQEWITEGVRPEMPEYPAPDVPADMFEEDMAAFTEPTRIAIDSGDPAQLKADLLAGAACGNYPVEIGSKETIADALAEG